MGYEDLQKAVVNRSLRSLKTELEFLKDANVITSAQYSSIIGNLPSENAAPVQQRAQEAPASNPVPAMSQMNINSRNDSNNEKNGYYQPTSTPTPNQPPPAYPAAPPAPSALATCSALYQYTAQDAGDLQLMPNDRIIVTEYMNAEWWKGRNEKTGAEGIFPSSYVKLVDEKGPMMPSVPTHQPSNYGNMPLDVAHNAGPSTPQQPGKGQEMGKKFGKKLGNAAIFGAGATIGGKIVNGIF